MPNLKLKNLFKYFGSIQILDDINITVNEGEFLVLVGPSGSGKSTILRIIAGLEEPSSGEIILNDKVINQISPKERDIAMVFQNYALYPHLTVFDNIAFPLKLKNIERNKVNSRVYEVAELLNIKQLLSKKPKELSGGERQRVALGRAIIRKPNLFLMDEPLSNLDAKLRTQMRSELLRLYKALKATIVYVTHDQIEALTMGSKIVVLNEGRVQQIDTPHNIYNSPSNLFVASFIGSPTMNLFNFEIIDEYNVSFLDEVYKLKRSIRNIKPGLINYFKTKLFLGIRPENVALSVSLDIDFFANVNFLEMLGDQFIVYASSVVNNFKYDFAIKLPNHCDYRPNDKLKISIDLSKCFFFLSSNGERLLI